MNQREERDLLERIAAGDHLAFTILFDAFHQTLNSFIFSIIKSKEQAEEITLDIFLKIWMTREALIEVNNFKAYLFTVSRNAAISSLRKVIRERTQHAEWMKNPDSNDDADVKEKEVYLSLIDDAINQLPPQRKKIYLLSRQEGLKYDEIAARLGISKFTVRAHIQQGIESIVKFVKSKLSLEMLLSFLIINIF